MAVRNIDDLKPDRRNANRGTRRGRKALEASLTRFGAARSIVAAANGDVIAGNKTLETARQMGMPIRVVPSNGEELIVVQRTDLASLEEKRARELAHADNRVSELDLDWDHKVLVDDLDSGLDLDDFWTPTEQEALHAKADEPEGGSGAGGGDKAEGLSYTVEFDSAAQLQAFHRLVEHLTEQYPAEPSLGARLSALMADIEEARDR